MHVLRAHDLLSARTDRSVLDCDVTLRGEDAWALAAAAAASLSGMLDDCNADAELDEALAHFSSLLSIEVVTLDQWQEQTIDVLRELMEWGDACEAAGQPLPAK